MTKKPTLELNAAEVDAAPAGDDIIIVNGLRLKMRKPRPIAQLRLVSIVGPEDAKNQVYMNLVGPLLWIEEIDGDPVGMLMSKRELEALFERLGDDGIPSLVEYLVAKLDIDPKTGESEAKN